MAEDSAPTYYERLSAESASFLLLDSTRTYGHSTTLLILENGVLARGASGVDFDAVRALLEARLHLAERYRQRLKWVPYEDHPVWVDDASFNLDYHLRHSALPSPGDITQLEKTAARIMAQRLDRNRPLWECWVLEGLEGDRFGLLLKTHAALLEDGGQAELLQMLLSPDPSEEIGEPEPFRPRPVPSGLELVRDEVFRRSALPRQAMRRLRNFAEESGNLRAEFMRRTHAVAKLLGYTIRPPRQTPLNGAIGPHRSFERYLLPLEDVRRVNAELGGSVHDVVLATVAGAVRRFLETRLVNPATLDFRISTPVSLDYDKQGGDVSAWTIELPLWERDPVKRFAMIREQTRAENDVQPGLAGKTLFSMARWSGSRLLTLGARSLSTHAGVNLNLLNVPGSKETLYFAGAPIVETYGLTPLSQGHGLGITVMSYAGTLYWGLNADYDLLPDLPRFAEGLEASFRELDRAVGRPALEVVDGGNTSQRRNASSTKS